MALSIDDSKINRSAPWYFSRLDPTGTVLAVAPSGQNYVIKHGLMDSEAGHELLNAMVRALSAAPEQLIQEVVPAAG